MTLTVGPYHQRRNDKTNGAKTINEQIENRYMKWAELVWRLEDKRKARNVEREQTEGQYRCEISETMDI